MEREPRRWESEDWRDDDADPAGAFAHHTHSMAGIPDDARKMGLDRHTHHR